MKGPAGYGRYDDDLARVGCPFARSRRSPCLARDGRLALTADPEPLCRGCYRSPDQQREDLALYYEPAGDLLPADPVTMADELAAMVREMTEPGREA
ncbi:MAG TPA: hypothetical protein VNH17_18050 [Streptosporangiaceae bacterium]|nr:hypothetical protein [Streptosporangiaceae bacterium]